MAASLGFTGMGGEETLAFSRSRVGWLDSLP
jgi:hypothetical protein